MKQEELNEVLRLHKLWLENNSDGVRANLRRADLRGADLRRADLRGANFRDADLAGADLAGADLRDADLRDANLRGAALRDTNLKSANLVGADLDFSVFPLWCGSFNIKVNERLPIQLIYHICKMKIETDDVDLKRLLKLKTFRKVANKFHRVKECGTV